MIKRLALLKGLLPGSVSFLGFTLLLAVAICAWTATRHRNKSNESEYVALGSSFAAGPGEGNRLWGSALPCMRSASNYPHLFAQKRGLTLTDVSCSGASTKNVLASSKPFLNSQVSAVQSDTKLVTITIGGNDVNYLNTLSSWSCAHRPSAVPYIARLAGVCRIPSAQAAAIEFAGLHDQLTAIIEQVRLRAPHTSIFFIDYVTILPASGTCGRIPLTASEADKGRAIAAQLRDVTANVAKETHVGLVRASDSSQAHNVCSSDPWVYGFVFPRTLASFGPTPYHPTMKAMIAIAALMDQQIPALRQMEGR